MYRFFERRWVCARYGYPNPEHQTFLWALLQCAWDGGELCYID